MAQLLPLVCGLLALAVVVGQAPRARLAAGVFLAIAALIWLLQRRLRLWLVLDDDGYAVEQRGRQKLRVHWSEVRQVRIDRREHALYVDCGDKARNLLVPPRRGFGFRFADAPALCARVLVAVPAERVVEVERIDVP